MAPEVSQCARLAQIAQGPGGRLTSRAAAADAPRGSELAQTLKVPSDALLGLTPVVEKASPRAARLLKRLQKIADLPATDQRTIPNLLDALHAARQRTRPPARATASRSTRKSPAIRPGLRIPAIVNTQIGIVITWIGPRDQCWPHAGLFRRPTEAPPFAMMTLRARSDGRCEAGDHRWHRR